MAKKQPIVAHLADKAARKARPSKKFTEEERIARSLSDNAIIAGAAARAGAASLERTKALVSTAKASPAKPARTVAPAPVAKPQVDMGGSHHLFVNLPLGALFTWDRQANMPGVYVKWAGYLFRKLNAPQTMFIHPAITEIRCYHLPENEVAKTLGETRFHPKD